MRAVRHYYPAIALNAQIRTGFVREREHRFFVL
jgi:hypothetical protein